jgi:hypothetical protein
MRQWQEDEEVEKSDGFWEEFFLLKPDRLSLKKILDDLSADDLLHFQVRGCRMPAPQELMRSPRRTHRSSF